MSRIGKKCIQVPLGVDILISGRKVQVKGPKGELSFVVSDNINVDLREGVLFVSPVDGSKKSRAAWGMSRTMLDNLVCGVSKGYEKRLEISGVGYRCSMVAEGLKISVGFSHDIIYSPPEEINVSVSKSTEVIVFGIKKQQVGQVAAEIRAYRKAEPYKGRGVKYKDENIVRKEGKKK
ncbi:MAG: 50S ribosomal protein L6 [Candidatus Liberibacter ctenarytainae]|uniref:Large ribosomal subunit protein uL6 n=1 Tax=Candidatus Liberibacter ctenarytainae TaxID=2020335 RepID=A0A937AJU2_9HYPH|nr:50S ribosomal protein L6 [Candidatus Liberibacter ctenarytainae]